MNQFCWETIADRIHQAGWSYGYVAISVREGRTFWQADAYRGDQRLIGRGETLLIAFQRLHALLEIE